MPNEWKKLPKHVSIIMDGNGRWAAQRGRPRFMGHRQGVKSVRKAVTFCLKNHIPVLSLFALSVENLLNRPSVEVSLLKDLFLSSLDKNMHELNEQNVRLCFVGDLSCFSTKMQSKINEGIMLTESNTGLTLIIAVNYSGRWDIIQAAAKMVDQHLKLTSCSDIGESEFAQYLSFSEWPDPDLLIRTGQEQRISNFMLWQTAYTEIYFSPDYWPDFNDEAFSRALDFYDSRERRFGKILESVTDD